MGRQITTARCNSWNDLADALHAAKKKLDREGEGIWFRGCREVDHQLLPSLMRDTQGLTDDDHDQFEQDLFYEFQARAGELRERGLSDWEYLFFGRHYGVPTRVLDWTDTFFVALYFALEEWAATSANGREPTIWLLNPYELNQESWDVRDIVLPRYLGMDEDGDYSDFGELLAATGWWAWDKPVALYPIQINQRVRAQRGWFTIHGNDRAALEEQCPESVAKLILQPGCVNEALGLLDLAGFNRFTLYPDLDNLARHLREQRVLWAKQQRSKSKKNKKKKRKKKTQSS
jgi:hypothetical protein